MGTLRAATSTYTYDNLNRLTSATIAGSRIEYQYDAAGNITRVWTPYTIVVSKIGTVGGLVVDDLGKVDCGDDCGGVYDLNTTVTLTAAPDPGVVFAGWSGACAGTGSCVVLVDGAESVVAAFVSEEADLVVTKTDGVATVAPGESVTYTIVVSNLGPGGVSDGAFSDTFPGSLTCDWTSVAAGSATGTAGSGSGSIAETLVLPTAGSVTYTAVCAVSPSATGTLSNTASVVSAISDPNPGDESATDTTDLVPAADLSLAKDAASAGVAVGADVVYTLAVANDGPSDAQSVQVLDTLPGGVALLSATGTGWSCGEAGGIVTCTRSTLAALASDPVEVTVTAPATPGSLFNQATVSSATPEAAAGDETDSVTVDVFGPPTIVTVGSVAATEEGEILPGLRTHASITQLYLVASHELADPPGDSDPNDATNPSSYRLFRAAPDGTFGSTTCSDPADVPVSQVTYGVAGPTTAAVYLGGAPSLVAGLYRVVACAGGGPTYLEDAYGSPLDGDADGTGGDDFVLEFEVKVTNLLVNPNLDDDLAGWDVTSETPGDVTHDATADASAAPTSGSANLVNLTGAGSSLALSQCVPVVAGEVYLVRARIRTDSLGPTYPQVSAQFETFDGQVCTSASLSNPLELVVTGDTGGLWVQTLHPIDASPAGAVSARVSFHVEGDETNAGAWIDDLQFFEETVVFTAGFEVGTTDEWDNTVGGP